MRPEELAAFGDLAGQAAAGATSQIHEMHTGIDWVATLRHVFTLGAPHLGAPLEQVTNAASAAPARLPEAAAR